jgi:hypothetical protein
VPERGTRPGGTASQITVAARSGHAADRWLIDRHHVMGTAKHFAVHGQPEGGTNTAPGNYSERIIRENFLVPFQAAVQEAAGRLKSRRGREARAAVTNAGILYAAMAESARHYKHAAIWTGIWSGKLPARPDVHSSESGGPSWQ